VRVCSGCCRGCALVAFGWSVGSGIAPGFSKGIDPVALAVLSLVAALHGPEAVLWVLVGMLVLAGLLSLAFPREARAAVGGH